MKLLSAQLQVLNSHSDMKPDNIQWALIYDIVLNMRGDGFGLWIFFNSDHSSPYNDNRPLDPNIKMKGVLRSDGKNSIKSILQPERIWWPIC